MTCESDFDIPKQSKLTDEIKFSEPTYRLNETGVCLEKKNETGVPTLSLCGSSFVTLSSSSGKNRMMNLKNEGKKKINGKSFLPTHY